MGKAKQFIPHSQEYFNLKQEQYEIEYRAPSITSNYYTTKQFELCRTFRWFATHCGYVSIESEALNKQILMFFDKIIRSEKNSQMLKLLKC